MFLKLLVAIFSLVAIQSFAADPAYDFNLGKSPFRTCVGKGTGEFSRYSHEEIAVSLNQHFIKILHPNKVIETYASLKSLCGVDLDKVEVTCDKQEENVTSTLYQFNKSCSSQIPRTNRTIFNFRLELTLNIKENNGTKTAFGSLNCVANQDGFRSIDITGCK